MALKPEAFRRLLMSTGLTQRRFAKLLRLNPHTVSKWACGHTPIPHSVGLLLVGLTHGYLTPDDLETLAREAPYEE